MTNTFVRQVERTSRATAPGAASRGLGHLQRIELERTIKAEKQTRGCLNEVNEPVAHLLREFHSVQLLSYETARLREAAPAVLLLLQLKRRLLVLLAERTIGLTLFHEKELAHATIGVIEEGRTNSDYRYRSDEPKGRGR